MRRHTESNNLVILTELIKLQRSVALIAIKDKESVRALRIRLCMSVKVLYLLKAKLVSCLSIVTKSDCLLQWEVFILPSLVELAS